MVKVRVTERDPSLPHQIRLSINKYRASETFVFCNCRGEALGEIPNAGNPWLIYNRAELHNNSAVPFVPRAHHDQNVKVYELE